MCKRLSYDKPVEPISTEHMAVITDPSPKQITKRKRNNLQAVLNQQGAKNQNGLKNNNLRLQLFTWVSLSGKDMLLNIWKVDHVKSIPEDIIIHVLIQCYTKKNLLH